MNMPASVTMKGCSRKRSIRKPCNAPKAVPIASTKGSTANGLQPWRCTSDAETMVVNAITEPTERSMPPARITKVMPTAQMIRKALSMNRFRNTCGAKKPV
jgi:hypothetical protein